MNAIKIGLLAGILIGRAQADAEAKHICPRIEPVVKDGVRFAAPNDEGFRGYVRATDAKSGTNLWEETIYRVVWRFALPELGLYYCVRAEMNARDGKLLIQNDRKKRYSLDAKTRRVRRIKAEEATEARKETDGHSQGGGYSPPAARSPKPSV